MPQSRARGWSLVIACVLRLGELIVRGWVGIVLISGLITLLDLHGGGEREKGAMKVILGGVALLADHHSTLVSFRIAAQHDTKAWSG
ncbi:hypothetical protein DL93DRAFT_2077802 [Clavulina sp. PMI_390]|nr:hypothetical protein DL93DRAFT_2077802 [Clavulina sp. PMI_390]